MTKTKKGSVCRRGLPLKRILNQWQRLNEKLAGEWSSARDVPWWYNERASLSVFAGAIWTTGELAFEEFSNEKRKISQRSSKFGKTYPGRVDIYFNVGGRDFISEAKICWPRCGNRKAKRQEMIETGLRSACEDVSKPKPNGQRQLGILFVSPRWKIKLRKELDERIDEWIAKVKNIECDAKAWTFPACARHRKGYGYFYPGAVVLIREV